jgi:hypothetical protein
MSKKVAEFVILFSILAGCNSLTSSKKDIKPQEKPASSTSFIFYTVMPEQTCPLVLHNSSLVAEQIVHPSAKLCKYQ